MRFAAGCASLFRSFLSVLSLGFLKKGSGRECVREPHRERNRENVRVCVCALSLYLSLVCEEERGCALVCLHHAKFSALECTLVQLERLIPGLLICKLNIAKAFSN